MKTLIFLYILAGYHSDVKLMPDEISCKAAIIALDRGDKEHGNNDDSTKAGCYSVSLADMKAKQVASDAELEKEVRRIIVTQQALLKEEKQETADPAGAVRLQQHLNDAQKAKP